MTDLDKYSDAHDWDGSPDVAKWNDIFSVDELAAVLEVHAAKAGKRGDYGASVDLAFASAALLELAEKLERK